MCAAYTLFCGFFFAWKLCVSVGMQCGKLLNHEREEHVNLCAYLIKDKFFHIHLLRRVILTSVGARGSSESRCKPPPQRGTPPKCLELPRRNGMKRSMNHRANVNTVCYPIWEIKHVSPPQCSVNCRMFCCLNSAWLQAAQRQMEVQLCL